MNRSLWAPAAWIGARWVQDVSFTIGDDGCWAAVEPGRPAPADAERLPGPVLPGLVLPWSWSHSIVDHSQCCGICGVAATQTPWMKGKLALLHCALVVHAATGGCSSSSIVTIALLEGALATT